MFEAPPAAAGPKGLNGFAELGVGEPAPPFPEFAREGGGPEIGASDERSKPADGADWTAADAPPPRPAGESAGRPRRAGASCREPGRTTSARRRNVASMHLSGAEILRQSLLTCRRSIIAAAFFSVAVNVLMLTVPIYLFQLSDRVLTSRSFETLLMLSLVAGGALALMVILDMTRRFLMLRVGTRFEAMLGAPLLANAIHSAVGGSRDVQALRDLQQVRSFVTGPVMLTVFDAPIAPLYFAVIFLIHPLLGWIITAAGLLLMIIAFLNQRLTDKPFSVSGQHAIRANSQASAQVRNAQVINAMGMLNESVMLWGRENGAALRAQANASDRNAYLSGISRFLRLIAQVCILGTGAYLALRSELTGGMMIAASIIASRALAPVESAIEGWRSFVNARNAYKRIKTQLSSSERQQQRLYLPRPNGDVSVERVLCLAPGSNRPLLNGVSFNLQPGESLAIIGPSGSGKSTLARLLVGCLTPTAGSVRLDLTDLRNWDPIQLGEYIGYLPQDVELFPGTIKANIARMRDDVPDEWITEAAQFAGVHEMISLFPDGYETEINLDGSPLSGGQRQQIALARAFFGTPQLVVLDEPNANLDSAGERALARALQRARSQGITVVVVTQRPAVLQHVGKILVLRDGRLEAFGEREQIMSQMAGATKQRQDSILAGVVATSLAKAPARASVE